MSSWATRLYRKPLSCEDEFKSVFQPISILRNQQHYGQGFGLRQKGSAQAWISQTGPKELVKGWSPLPHGTDTFPLQQLFAPTPLEQDQQCRLRSEGQSCRVRCCNGRRGGSCHKHVDAARCTGVSSNQGWFCSHWSNSCLINH